MRAKAVKVEQTVREGGNCPAVQLTAPAARAARLTRAVPIEVEVVEGGGFLRVAGKAKPSLKQKLKMFDPAKHGGEAMAVPLTYLEMTAACRGFHADKTDGPLVR